MVIGIATKNYLVISSGFSIPRRQSWLSRSSRNPMRRGRIPNRKLQNPHTIAAHKRFQTKPWCSPQRHHKLQCLDRCNRKAATVNRAEMRIYRVGTVYYQPTSAGYLVALPNPISVTKNLAGGEQP
jgi:hypothetical protein